VLALQLALGIVALAACAFLPRSGGAVLLIPLGSHVAAIDGAFIARYHVRLIGAGRLHGSVLVYANTALAPLALLRDGRLGLAAPAFLCGPMP